MALGPDEQLAWEAERRPRAGVAGILAAILTLGAGIANGVLFADAPRASSLDALDRALRPGSIDALESLRVPFYEFYDERLPSLVATSLARAAGLLAIAFVLTFLGAAVRARRPELPKAVLYLGLAGGVLSAVATVLSTVASAQSVRAFLDGPRTVGAADDVAAGTLLTTAQLIGLPGALALGLGFVLIGLNAMRAGLLTRFMGVLAIIVGVLVVLPLGSPLPIVQCFWLFALGLLLLGRWPRGEPPAWRTGRAEPWPTQQEIRAQRQRDLARRRGEPVPEPETDGERVAAVAAGEDPPPPGGRRRKRKRRD